METVVFIIAAVIVVLGSLGVVLAKHTVHNALMLVATLFGIAVLFLAQDAQFLAVVQVIVYAGAIVVLFLFVIMLLGVDKVDDLRVEPLGGQRPLALALGVAVMVLGIVFVAVASDNGSTGQPASTAAIVDSVTGQPIVDPLTGEDLPTSATELREDDQEFGTETESNIRQLGRVVFTDYVWAFEITAVLLTIAVVAAVALARRPDPDDREDIDEGYVIPPPERLIDMSRLFGHRGDDDPADEDPALVSGPDDSADGGEA
ncbi:MAG: NADH-quinone oxidoreductase subunit J [Acidimicrobiales bacterium]